MRTQTLSLTPGGPLRVTADMTGPAVEIPDAVEAITVALTMGSASGDTAVAPTFALQASMGHAEVPDHWTPLAPPVPVTGTDVRVTLSCGGPLMRYLRVHATRGSLTEYTFEAPAVAW